MAMELGKRCQRITPPKGPRRSATENIERVGTATHDALGIFHQCLMFKRPTKRMLGVEAGMVNRRLC
jgi:hypothetical protein